MTAFTSYTNLAYRHQALRSSVFPHAAVPARVHAPSLPSPPLRWRQRRAPTTIDGPRGARRCPSLDPRRRGSALSLLMAAVLHLPCAAVPLHLLGVDSGPSRGEGSLPSTLLDLSEGRGKAQQGLPQQIRPNNLGCVWRCCLLDRAFGTASGRWNLG
ncbi:hypothetical protein SORBI_3003G068750 [Sorghum bicolor]|uniref:Uncharacterized protein n=1 Tax=Sorghum bicolor TaxID=4558 RepID=A0A1W0VW01_SORBI|nr:hypothetical protein SORBI_3003G068750 [Sorghum bicolor]